MSNLVSIDGKTPLSSRAKAEVLIQVKYTAPGGRSAPKVYRILAGEVDGDINLVQQVVQGAANQLIQTLVRLGVVIGQPSGPNPT